MGSTKMRICITCEIEKPFSSFKKQQDKWIAHTCIECCKNRRNLSKFNYDFFEKNLIKTCSICAEKKVLDLFVKDSYSKDGTMNRCKTCHSHAQKKYSEKNKKENNLNKIHLKVDSKICNRCKINKKIDKFHKSHRLSDGYRNTCKKCYQELSKIKRDERYKKIIDSATELKCGYCHKTKKLNHFSKSQLCTLNPGCKICKSYINMYSNKKSISPLYNLSRKQYNEMVEKQNNLCAICGNPEKYRVNGIIKRLAVDHCHKAEQEGKSKVRSLLCGSCNVGLGSFADSSSLLRNAAAYIDFHNESS